MEGIIVLIIIWAVMAPILKAAMKVKDEVQGQWNTESTQNTSQTTQQRVYRYNYERIEAQKAQNQQVPYAEPISSEGQSKYAPVKPHIAPHVHTIHSVADKDADCEAHIAPVSSEGSDVRAHVHTSADSAGCVAHSVAAPTEGLNFQGRFTEKLKSTMDTTTHALSDTVEPTRTSFVPIEGVRFDRNAVLSGVIYSEVLGKPKARQHH